MISIVVPYHDMQNGAFFLKRCLDSIMMQSYKDYEVVLVKDGRMAANTNTGIRKAKGSIIKILYMDDYFRDEQSLGNIRGAFRGAWLVSGCLHDDGVSVGNPHLPTWNPDIKRGNNTIGSPSVLTFLNRNSYFSLSKDDENIYFDENMSWLLDCDLYDRFYKENGPPVFLNTYNVVLGIGPHQVTNLMSDEEKLKEHHYLNNKV